MFWLCHKNKLSVYHLLLCVRVRLGMLDICYCGSFTTFPLSDEKQTCIFTSVAAKKKIFEGRFQFHSFQLQLQLLI